jgi:hypothetical protein
MIYCVWYPSGGFGHFINAILTLHGDNFIRPTKSLEFSENGNSHSLDLVVPKYFKDCWPGGIEFLNNKNYCVLVDNGINNPSTAFKSTFSNSTVVKVCYSNYSWPVVARTMIEKAMGSSLDKELSTDQWNTDESWTKREKYFLYLRDHELRYAWRSELEHELSNNEIDVGDLYQDYDNCHASLNAVVDVGDFYPLWKEWRSANAKYIDPATTAYEVLTSVVTRKSEDLTHITDIWTQAVIYYYIWVKYSIEVPHNDFANFFTNTDQIIGLTQ